MKGEVTGLGAQLASDKGPKSGGYWDWGAGGHILKNTGLGLCSSLPSTG
ncbi:hypothetical protein LEMLEM_LOCUS255 [Lemmus lemmus]